MNIKSQSDMKCSPPTFTPIIPSEDIKVTRVCQRLQEEQGYVVIASLFPYEIGSTIHTKILYCDENGEHIEYATTIKVIAYATEEEWFQQGKLLGRNFQGPLSGYSRRKYKVVAE